MGVRPNFKWMGRLSSLSWGKINDLKGAIKDKNVDRVKRGMEELTKASHKLAEEIYKVASKQKTQSGPAGGAQEKPEEPQEEPNTGKNKEDIIDAEFREEDDKK